MKIAVISGKGGTGKTYFSTSLAMSLEEADFFDLDVEEPNGYIFIKPVISDEVQYILPVPEIDEDRCTFCNKCAESCAYNALSILPQLQKALFFPELCHSCGVCSFVCPVDEALIEVDKDIGVIRRGKFSRGNFIEGKLNIGEPSGVPLISGIMKDHLNTERTVIIDSPPGTSCPVVESIKKADYVIIVTEPTPFGLSDMKLVIEIVKDLGKRTGVVINKDRGDSKDTEEFLRKCGIPVIFRIPYSLEIQKSYSKGIPLIDTVPGIGKKLKRLYEDI
ncbi:MAG: ATP-binding protein, partial [Candidatus Aminicenantes bacterium]|nr:ATP-binding protein [Candidatus Aminicenantes bacterium]